VNIRCHKNPNYRIDHRHNIDRAVDHDDYQDLFRYLLRRNSSIEDVLPPVRVPSDWTVLTAVDLCPEYIVTRPYIPIAGVSIGTH
jgi:hypothetical protein